MKIIIITVDGPAASGKAKISKYISNRFNFKHLDSGILYRRLAYIFLNEHVNLNDIDEIKKKLKEIHQHHSYKSHLVFQIKLSAISSGSTHKGISKYSTSWPWK